MEHSTFLTLGNIRLAVRKPAAQHPNENTDPASSRIEFGCYGVLVA